MAEAVYDMDWYEMDNRMTKHFILFLMKVQQPSEIKSLLFHVNKPLFVSVSTIHELVFIDIMLNNPA